MKKHKVLVIMVLLLFMVGCTNSPPTEDVMYLVDEETCVQYIKFYGYRGVSVRLKANGKPMLDKECLKAKGGSYE